MKFKILTHASHLPALIELENICFASDRLSGNHFRYHLKNPRAQIIAGFDHAKIIACAMILFRKNSQRIRIYTFSVHPDYRKKKIARALLLDIEKAVNRIQRASELFLEVRCDNKAAINFYLQAGFQIFSTYENFYADGCDALRMKKYLLSDQMKLK